MSLSTFHPFGVLPSQKCCRDGLQPGGISRIIQDYNVRIALHLNLVPVSGSERPHFSTWSLDVDFLFGQLLFVRSHRS